MRLALALGMPNVDEMLSSMSGEQFAEWVAFYRLEPFGYEAGMVGHAITASTIANTNRGKGQKPFKPETFMPRLEEREGGGFFSELKSYLLKRGGKV